ncbi:unnamed protein product, partial [Polarella glacialis]
MSNPATGTKERPLSLSGPTQKLAQALRRFEGATSSKLREFRAKYPYEELVSDSVAYCYAQLVANSFCCQDQAFAAGASRHEVRRAGTEWRCGDRCLDSQKGRRGDDVLWIPEGASCSSPRLLWIHGGSWQWGSPDTESYGQLGSKLAALSGAVVMLIDYPLAPEGNFSTILQAALQGLQWLAEAPLADLNCASSSSSDGQAPLFLGGDSSGGGTALSLVLQLKKDGGGQSLAGVILFSPWTNLRCDTPDYYFNAFAKINDTTDFQTTKLHGEVYVGDLMFRGHPKENLDKFTVNAVNYTGADEDLSRDPIASPFYAGPAELAGGGLPPLYFAVGGSEAILGDSLIVAQKAAFYGAKVHVDVGVGLWHDFPMYSEGCGSGKEIWQAKRTLNRTAQFIREMAADRTRASSLGLLWPPAQSSPGTPHTRYVYDLSRKSSREWFPEDLDAALGFWATSVEELKPDSL